jgi:hypothetical protein
MAQETKWDPREIQDYNIHSNKSFSKSINDNCSQLLRLK